MGLAAAWLVVAVVGSPPSWLAMAWTGLGNGVCSR